MMWLNKLNAVSEKKCVWISQTTDTMLFPQGVQIPAHDKDMLCILKFIEEEQIYSIIKSSIFF